MVRPADITQGLRPVLKLSRLAVCLVIIILPALSIFCRPHTAAAATLSDLGYPQGLTLTAKRHSITLFFPLPEQAETARLTLNLRSSSLLGPRAGLTILAEDQPLLTVAGDRLDAPLSVSIPPSLLHSRYLRVTFQLSPASATLECQDDAAALWVDVEPKTELTATSSAPQGVGAVWRQMQAPLAIALPAKPQPRDIETALILATALVERGITPSFAPSATPAIRVDPAAPALAVTATGTAQALTVPSPAAARALIAGAGALSGSTTSAAASLAPQPIVGNRASFAALGIGSVAIPVGETAQFNIPLPTPAIPAQEHATALILNGQGETLPPGQSLAIALHLGAALLWSEAFRGVPRLDHIRIPLPDTLLASGARPFLTFTRSPAPAPCMRQSKVVFSLLDSSAFLLGAGRLHPARLAAFSVAGGGATPLLLDLPPAEAAPSLPLLAQLLGAAGAQPGQITLAPPGMAPVAPFLVLSRTMPSLISAAPLPDPRARLDLSLPAEGLSLALPDPASRSVLQLVSTAQGIPGLWLSPGSAASLTQAVLPGDGDVALYDGSGQAATFETTARHAAAPLPPGASLTMLLQRWKGVIILVLWMVALALTVVFVIGRRKPRT
ncbi:cellulose biosynthesis cyclic di-GMP-binding regulatory protein BcsB [Acidisoma sp. C75]